MHYIGLSCTQHGGFVHLLVPVAGSPKAWHPGRSHTPSRHGDGDAHYDIWQK